MLRWRNLWTGLLYAFGAAIILFSIAAILLFIRESWIGGALSTLGTIVSGVGIKWVVTRRNEAVKEEIAAYQEVVKHCNDKSGADALRRSFAVRI